MPMVALDVEFNCPSCGKYVFHGSDIDFPKNLKNFKSFTAKSLGDVLREIQVFDYNP